ncbi:protein-disulfide reductase DsbD N-terminal domain-containing protein [Mucilaginibacter defluvii]|uniref:Thiol:disulfide interchange protein DsbD N-terminal domain-containing protein n=1 Tax=Mucilaginibacter defluvii TaxID=1196019 RepID=A0ABP9G6N5_9SPHI
MKKLLVLFAAIMLSASAFAQIETPVKWSYAAKRVSKTEAVVFFKATMEDGWHIYSQNVKEGGPNKTSFTFAASKDFTPVGKTTEPKGITKYEKVFGMDVTYFEKSVIFQQKIKLKTAKATTVKGKLEYMTCNDMKCLPPEEVAFSIPVK